MKKFFTNIFNIAAIAGFVLLFATLIGTFVVSYKFVDKMAKHEGPELYLALETAKSFADVFSPSSLQTISELNQSMAEVGKMGEQDKIVLAAKLPIMVLKVGAQVAVHIVEEKK